MFGKLLSSFSDTKPRMNPKLLVYPEKTIDGKFISYPPISKRLAAAAGDCIVLIFITMPIIFLLTHFLHPEGLLNEISSIYNEYYDQSKNSSEAFNKMNLDPRYNIILIKQIFIQISICVLIIGSLLFFNFKYNSSPAKMAFKCYVLDAETYKYPTKKQFFIRNICYIFTIGTLFLGLIFALCNPRRRMIHDIMAKTVVVKLTDS